MKWLTKQQQLHLLHKAFTEKPIDGNDVTLYANGAATYKAMIEEIDGAKNFIHLESYIFASDESGYCFAKHLINKAQSGIVVRVIYDAIGSFENDPDFATYLIEGGVQLQIYNGLNTLKKLSLLNKRNHRKLLVVDHAIGFIGGINICDTYTKLGEQNWRDTHLKVTGPVVLQINNIFLTTFIKKEVIPTLAPMLIPSAKTGDDTVIILKNRLRLIYKTLLHQIKEAKEEILITTAYFLPPRQFRKALIQKANSGVTVKIIIPEKSDIGIIQYATYIELKKVLKHNIEVYLFQNRMIHAKTVVIDRWATVGSTNLDHRSFSLNLEANAILGPQVANRLKMMFYEDLKQCRRLTLDQLNNRSVWSKIVSWICYRFRKVL